MRLSPQVKSGGGGDLRKAVENPDAAGGAARECSTLVVVWNPVFNRRFEQGLPVGRLDRTFVGVGDPVHWDVLQTAHRPLRRLPLLGAGFALKPPAC